MKKNKDTFNGRIRAVKGKLKRQGLDALIVSEPRDMEYLTGFSCEGSRLLVLPERDPVYFIDTMNVSLAEKALRGVRLADIVPGRIFPELRAFMRETRIKKTGVRESSFTVPEFRALGGDKGGFRILDAAALIADMRQVKSALETALIRRAAFETVKIWRRFKKQVEPGMKESDMARIIDTMIREKGLINSFPTIAASGPNTAYPHWVPSDRKVRPGELVLVDFGVRYGGYCSDLTRVLSVGRIDRQIRGLKDLVAEAQEAAIKRIKPGISIGALAFYINSILVKNGAGAYILHSLGHGVGLDVHEKPSLREGVDSRLKKGMVVTVEPGLYKKGLGGVRVEDMVLVTEKGCEVLTV